MSSFEHLVRPFQRDSVFSARRQPPEVSLAELADPEVAYFEWVGAADSQFTQAPPPATLGYQAKWQEDRSRRKTEKVRVENPNDSEQYVMLERIQRAVFQNNMTGEEIDMQMEWD